jgi:hypothetical protein
MKKMRSLSILFIILILTGCSTIKFGVEKKNLFDEVKKEKDIREFNLSYSYKVMGIPVTGPKSVIETIFQHPNGKTTFVFVSFPKIGILKTNDNGANFTSQFFRLRFLDTLYNYIRSDEDDDTGKKTKNENKQNRFFSHSGVSKLNPDKVILTLGPYLFVTKDLGQKWTAKNIFFDNEKANIKDVFVTDKDEIIIMTENKIAFSKDWGEKWDIKYFRIQDFGLFKTNYVSGFYDAENGILYGSFLHSDDQDFILSKQSYDFFYNKKNVSGKSGLFYSKDMGKSWIKTKINIPLVLWKFENKIYGSSIYPLSFYNANFSEEFKNSSLYKDGKLDKTTDAISVYYKTLIDTEIEDFQIISAKNNKLINIQSPDNFEIIDETNFDNIFTGLKQIDKVDYINWKENWYSEKKSSNFCFEYNPYRMFKLWTGMRTNSPVLYEKKDEIYYRIKPQKEYLKSFFKYSVENQIRLNAINPFMRKNTDIEFFDPALDPTNGMPITIEYSNDNGKTWTEVVESIHFRNIIDPLGNKRSGFYWYKNVDQKKSFKLQISFGFDQGASFLVYPMDLMFFNDDLFLSLNYFSIMKSYKDGYLVPLKNKENIGEKR